MCVCRVSKKNPKEFNSTTISLPSIFYYKQDFTVFYKHLITKLSIWVTCLSMWLKIHKSDNLDNLLVVLQFKILYINNFTVLCTPSLHTAHSDYVSLVSRPRSDTTGMSRSLTVMKKTKYSHSRIFCLSTV